MNELDKKAMQFSCLWCEGGTFTPWLANCHDLYLGKGPSVSYVACDHCKAIQQWPLANIGALYDNYPIHEAPSAARKFIGNLLNHPIYFSPEATSHKVLLDYGCGNGTFLESCKRFPGARAGYEPSAAQAARVEHRLGCKVYATEETLLEALRGSVDVLTMHMVLEHLEDPLQAFSLAAQLLADGGIFYFCIPNPYALEARVFGRYWHGLDAPRHLSFPSTKAIEMAAAGQRLKVVKTRPVSFPNTLSGSLASLGGQFSSSVFLASSPIALFISRLLPQGSQGYWLQKSP